MKKIPVRHAPRLPSYLYKKRGVFYYRLRLSKETLDRFGEGEVRVSLRTGFKKEAISMAKQVHEHISKKIDMGSLANDNLSNQERLSQLRQAARNFVDDLLAEPNKKSLSERDIRLRLNGYLKHELDRTAHSPELMPELEYVHPDGQVEARPLSHVFERIAQKQSHESNTGENIEQWFETNLIELVQLGIFDRPEITHENSLVLARAYQRTKATLNSVLAARQRGDYVYEQSFYAADGIQYPSTGDHNPAHIASPQNSTQPATLIKLSELINTFCDSQLADKAWKPRMVPDHRNRLEDIVYILGDVDAASVTRQQMRHVKDVLSKLPASRKKKKEFKGKTVEEILQMNYDKTLSSKSINDRLEAISSMFRWATREKILVDNPAIGLRVVDDTPEIEKVAPFTIQDIQKIFFSGDYKRSEFKNSAQFWVPLIGLYTGMRLEEICQLYCKDVYEDEDGIYIIDINLNDGGINDKELKTKNAIRKIPVHQYLIERGIKDFVVSMKKSGENRLFPELKKSKSTNRYGKEITNWFSKLVKKKKIEGKKSFHSLRHSFSQFYKEKGLKDEVYTQIFGHEQGDLASRVYGSRIPPKICYERIISKLTYSPEDRGIINKKK